MPSYDQLLDRFTKVVCQADRQQVMLDAVSVRRKRRRSDSTEEKEKPTADEESAESDSGEGSDADPRHNLKPSEKNYAVREKCAACVAKV